MKGVYFISGIDTDCGKTYVTGHLAKELTKKGKKLITHKLIQTGCKNISEDIVEHRRIMGVELYPEDKNGETCPYVLSYPASPHLASKTDGISLDFDKMYNSIKKLKSKYEIVLSEGAGGLMVPLSSNYLTIDFVRDYKLDLILVTSSKLGSLNHTLLSLLACKEQQINVPFVIYNSFPQHDAVISNDSFKFLEKYLDTNFKQTKLLNSKHLYEINIC